MYNASVNVLSSLHDETWQHISLSGNIQKDVYPSTEEPQLKFFPTSFIDALSALTADVILTRPKIKFLFKTSLQLLVVGN